MNCGQHLCTVQYSSEAFETREDVVRVAFRGRGYIALVDKRFRNLCSLPALRSHNFSNFFPARPVERVSEEYIAGHLQQSYQPHPHGGLEPYFDSVFELSLSPDCCASFLRANPDLPITGRDYYLSKLFQFLYESLRVAYDLAWSETEVRERVEEFLGSIPAEMLDRLSTFDFGGFHYHSARLQLEELLARLPEFLPELSESIGAGEKEPPAGVIDRWRRARNWTIEILAAEAGVDIKQVYKVKRGEGVHTDTVIKLAKALGCKPGDLLPE